MIRRLYDGYVDSVAADRGVWAFFKWFILGVVYQLALMIPAIPLLVVGVVLGADAAQFAAAAAFLAAFLATRVFLFALPCRTAAERKGLGSPLTWAVGGFVFGQIALGLVAALPPRTSTAAA